MTHTQVMIRFKQPCSKRNETTSRVFPPRSFWDSLSLEAFLCSIKSPFSCDQAGLLLPKEIFFPFGGSFQVIPNGLHGLAVGAAFCHILHHLSGEESEESLGLGSFLSQVLLGLGKRICFPFSRACQVRFIEAAYKVV